MKFTCPKCNTRYTLAEDKIPAAAALRFTCKKCGNVIRVKRKEGEPVTPPPSDASAPQAKPTSKVEERRNEPSAAPLADSAPAGGYEEGVTRIASLKEIRALKEASATPGAGRSPSSASSPSLSARTGAPPAVSVRKGAAATLCEWLVLVGGKQKGPLSTSELGDMFRRGEVDKRTYVWREGMGEWQRLVNVSALSSVMTPGESDAQAAPAPAAKQTGSRPALTPFDSGAGADATVMMSAAQLKDHLAKAAQAAAVEQGSAGDAKADAPSPAPAAKTPAAHSDAGGMTVAVPLAKLRQSGVGQALPGKSEQLGDAFSTPFAASDEDATRTSELRASGPALTPEGAASIADLMRGTGSQSKSGPLAALLRDTGSQASSVSEPPLAALMRGTAEISDDDLEQVSEGDAPSLPSAISEVEPGTDAAYLTAPPGEATRVFLKTAGIYRRRRQNRIAAIIAISCAVGLFGLVSLDVAGVYTLPGMGAIYDMTGIADPNLDRAVERVESKLKSSELSAEERETLGRKLLGLRSEASKKNAAKKGEPDKTQAESRDNGKSIGIEDKKSLSDSERAIAADIFGDQRKKEVGLRLTDPSEIQTPNLPDGLTHEAIFKVITDNTRSMKLCLEEAYRKGDKPAGKMEVQLTIVPDGSVSQAEIPSPQFRDSNFGSCTIRRAKNWKFPRFNGEAVTVVFPYVLSSGF